VINQDSELEYFEAIL